MNVEFQCCGIIILVILFILFLKEKNLGITNSKLFFFAILSCIVCEFFDILSIVAIYYSTNYGFSTEITNIVCKLYLCSLALQGYQGFLYASSEVLGKRKYRKIRLAYFLFFIAGTIGIFCTDISFYMQGRTVYSYGPSTKVTYGVAVFLMISIIVIAFRFKGSMSKRRRNAMLIWQMCWLVAAAIQFICPELLLVGFAAAIGMIILYSELENPNEFIDRESGLFTRNGMKMFVRDKYHFEKPFSVLYVKAKFLSDIAEYEIETKVTAWIVDALRCLGNDPAFRLDDNLYAVIYDTPERMRLKLSQFRSMVDSINDNRVDGAYILVPDSTLFDNAEDFFRFQRYYDDAVTGTIIADSETIEKVRKQDHIRTFIDNALRDDRVQIYYQPFYDVQAGRYTAAEALLRVLDENGNIVPPMDIIPVAEENGQIIPLGIRIFEKVCEFLATGKAQALGIEYIEVNISVAQFDTNNPYAFVIDTIEKYNVKPEWINLEITETASNESKNLLLHNMNKLIAAGIEFSLDDFGTGRSNLDYFVNMPVRNIKFDYTFTQGFFTNDKVKQIFTGMVDVLHNMDMTIVSEGVETKEQMSAMIDLGVEYIQGYYFSKPICEQDFLEFLRKNNRIEVNSNDS